MWRKGVYALRRAARVIAGAAGVGMFASMQALAASGHAGASQKEENSGRGRDVSQGKYESPELASLTRVVAETLDEICMSGKNDVVLAVTGENCQTCAYIKPVARQLARVFEGEDRVVIGTMDGDKNFKRGFFDETEANTYPLLKIFPAKGGGDPVTVTTRPGVCASDVIRLLHERAGNKFDLDAALQRSESLQDQTRAELKEAVEGSVVKSWNDLFPTSPCRDVFSELSVHRAYINYMDRRPGDLDKLKELVDKVDECNLRDGTYRYYQTMAEAAKLKLGDMADKLNHSDDKGESGTPEKR